MRISDWSSDVCSSDLGTALPEVAAAIAAARRGQGDMVAGHVIGSSVFNLLVVLGGMAVVRDVPVPASFVRFELPAALVFALMLYPMLRGDLRVSRARSEEHTSELQSLMRISYAVFCLKKKT